MASNLVCTLQRLIAMEKAYQDQREEADRLWEGLASKTEGLRWVFTGTKVDISAAKKALQDNPDVDIATVSMFDINRISLNGIDALHKWAHKLLDDTGANHEKKEITVRET